MIAAEFNDPQTASRQRRLHRKSSNARWRRGSPADLWRIRQRDSLPVSADHPDAQFDAAMKILQDALSD